MSFDWTTFFLELVNFLLLLWILQHFLYRPVLGVIAARREAIEDRLREAGRKEAEAETLRQRCEQNLAAWEKEKLKARADLDKDLAAQRERLLRGLAEEIAEARAKRQAQEEQERREFERLAERRALELGGRFVARLLERLAGPELEERLVALTLADLPTLPEAEGDKLRTALAGNSLEVVSAFPLNEGQKAAIGEAFARLAGQQVHPQFRHEPSLLAGLRVHAGPWVLSANLQDELQFFRDVHA